LYWPIDKQVSDYNYNYAVVIAMAILQTLNTEVITKNQFSKVSLVTTNKNKKDNLTNMMKYYNSWKNDKR
jgi:hypothetical protein